MERKKWVMLGKISVLALLVIIPLTPGVGPRPQRRGCRKKRLRRVRPRRAGHLFKPTIGNACGSIGLLDSAINGPAADFVQPDSDLAAIRSRAIPLPMTERADMLYNSVLFELAHKSVEEAGDTLAMPAAEHAGQHFVAFVKAEGKLWELEGSRKGPLERGSLADDEDVLSLRALEMGLKRIMKLESDAGEEISVRAALRWLVSPSCDQ